MKPHKDRIEKVKKIDYGHNLNCWGTTVFVLGAVDRIHWANGKVMREWLESTTRPLEPKEKRQRGDILVMFDEAFLLCCDDPESGITHTAVYVGGGKYFHKCGAGKARYDNQTGVLSSYSYTKANHVRPVKEDLRGTYAA